MVHSLIGHPWHQAKLITKPVTIGTVLKLIDKVQREAKQ